jgi:uncharacterized membrane protein YhaH (DUF805 family)
VIYVTLFFLLLKILNSMNYYIEALKKYAVFEGRARRKEFWIYTLVNFAIVATLLGAFSLFLEANNPFAMIICTLAFLGYSLFQIIPSIAVSVRRLHDTNRSGWWLLLSIFVPFIGPMVLFIFFITDSWSFENQYGIPPKPVWPYHPKNIYNNQDKFADKE